MASGITWLRGKFQISSLLIVDLKTQLCLTATAWSSSSYSWSTYPAEARAGRNPSRVNSTPTRLGILFREFEHNLHPRCHITMGLDYTLKKTPPTEFSPPPSSLWTAPKATRIWISLLSILSPSTDYSEGIAYIKYTFRELLRIVLAPYPLLRPSCLSAWWVWVMTCIDASHDTRISPQFDGVVWLVLLLRFTDMNTYESVTQNVNEVS